MTAIRSLGHDCLDAATILPRMQDVAVLRMAAAEERIVLTADKDFGELVFAHRIPSPGVVLIRLTAARESDRVSRLCAVWSLVLSRLPGSFVTIADGGVRARPIAWS